MSSSQTTAILFGCLVAALLLARVLRRFVPEQHLSADSKDTIKLAMGLVATMTALLLGLLVSSAKGSYDTARNNVIHIAAKAALLDRVLTAYGAEAEPLRAQFREIVASSIHRMWPESERPAELAPDAGAGDRVYAGIQSLLPRDEMQRTLKDQASKLGMEIAQLRTLLMAQSAPSIALPLLIVVASWLSVVFFGFSLMAPRNATAGMALVASAISVAGAIFLILELDRPFGGVLQIPSAPLENCLSTST